jgi:sugar lactone lactonase YvrE
MNQSATAHYRTWLLVGVLLGAVGLYTASSIQPRSLLAEWATEALLVFLAPKTCANDFAQVTNVIRLPAETPELYESLVALENGDFVVTAATRGELIRVSRDGSWNLLATLPVGKTDLTRFNGLLGGMVVGRDSAIYAAVNAIDAQWRGIWRVDRKGNSKLWSRFPEQATLNGMAMDSQGNLFVADSSLGLIWKVSPQGEAPVRWHESQLAGANRNVPLPTANGLKIHQNHVYLSNTWDQHILKIPVLETGESGREQLWDTGVAGDDFAIDEQGHLYLTTHPFNTVVRLQQSEACKLVADQHRSNLAGPTAAVFGERLEDRDILYVLNDGGFSRKVENGFPSIVALSIDP